MRSLTVMFVLAAALVGCGFKAGPAVSTGSGGSGVGNGGSGGKGGASAGGKGGVGLSTGAGGIGLTTGVGGTGGDVVFTGTAGMGGSGCGQTNIDIMPLPPDILIVQDRSLSMTDTSGGAACDGGTLQGNGNCGATSKWSQTTTALNMVLSQTDTTVNWGLYWLGDEAAQCGVSATPAVPIEAKGYSDISGKFAANLFNGQPGTPTAPAINGALTYMKTLTDPNPKFLLLATDGAPNCPSGANSINTMDTAGAQQAVANALAAGFPTFVVGIATTNDPAASTAMNALAVAGGEPQPNASTQYYSVTDTASLVTALKSILKITASCQVSLAGAPSNLNNVAVSAQDPSGGRIEITADPNNGWSFDATKANIILNGTACADLQNGTYTNYQFIYACADTVICVDNCPGQ